MSYNTQARMAQDEDLKLRVTACVATQNVGKPVEWAENNMWNLSATPGWDEKYNYAVDSGVDRPGYDMGVLSDNDILSGVQARLTVIGAGSPV